MQDLRQIPTGLGNVGNAGRFFGGDRRLRPYPNQALKCPRCDSLNTKFCYYNNYNLSQPRHFCKSCRRYWTKGGVLRNVPEGGGCRKNKRSKPKSSSSDHHKEKKAKSSSSSDSSSLTGTNNTEGTASAPSTTATATATAGSSSSVQPPPSGLLNFTDSSRLFINQTSHPNDFENSSVLDNLDQSTPDGGMFSENGGFTNLMNVGNTYNFSDISPFRLNHQQQQEMEKMVNIVDEMKMQELTAGCMDQTVEIDMSGLHSRTHNGELTALDWQSSQGLFDLPNTTVDQGYWSQNQWTEADQHLYLP